MKKTEELSPGFLEKYHLIAPDTFHKGMEGLPDKSISVFRMCVSYIYNLCYYVGFLCKYHDYFYYGSYFARPSWNSETYIYGVRIFYPDFILSFIS